MKGKYGVALLVLLCSRQRLSRPWPAGGPPPIRGRAAALRSPASSQPSMQDGHGSSDRCNPIVREYVGQTLALQNNQQHPLPAQN